MAVSPFSSWAFPLPGTRKKGHHETAVGLLCLLVFLQLSEFPEKMVVGRRFFLLKYSPKLTVCSLKSKVGGFLISTRFPFWDGFSLFSGLTKLAVSFLGA